MLAQISGAGSAAADAGWGVGLTILGLSFATGAIVFITDYKSMATGTVESLYDARRQLSFVISRPNTPRRLRQARYAVGGAMTFMALAFLTLGVFEFTQI